MIHAAGFATAELRPTLMGRWHPAVRLGSLVLALATGLAAGPVGAVLLPVAAGAGLVRAGLPIARQLALLRPWWPIALLVLVIHTLTALDAAPLGHPTLLGAQRGGLALLRLAGSLLALGLYLRLTGMDEIVTGLQWWLRPLSGLGVPVADLGLVLAVALSTAPTVLAEGRRMEAVGRLRRCGPTPGCGRRSRLRSWWDRFGLVVPLLEGMSRRTDAVSLSLRNRRPGSGAGSTPVPALELLMLVVWSVGLVLWLVVRYRGVPW